jgi:hypothetical protein
MLFGHSEFKYPWFIEGSYLHERTIIKVCPEEAKVVKGKKFDFMVTLG